MEDCEVCFNLYDGTERRPRVLPCGHSFCNECIQHHMKQTKLVCPTCRREHFAVSSEDFPINYGMEKYIQSTPSAPPCEDADSIAEWLRFSMEQHCKDLKKLQADIGRNSSQMQGYKSRMKTWKEEHQSLMEFHQTCAQKHSDVITCICKENQTMEDASGQADNILQEVRASVSSLHAANSSSELSISMEKSKTVYDTGHQWHSAIQKTYPNNELMRRSQQLRQQSSFIMEKLRSAEWKQPHAEDDRLPKIAASTTEGAKGISEVDSPLFSMQEMTKGLQATLESLHMEQITPTEEVSNEQISQTHDISFLNVSDLKALTPYLRSLIESNRVFAVQQHPRETRYARISIDNYGEMCLHVLCNDISVPVGSVFVRHGDLVGDGIHPGLTFLELAAEGRPLGRLRIRLLPCGNYPLNFQRLCTGEVGPSHIKSTILEVFNKDRDREFVSFGSNEDTGDTPVVPGVDWEVEWDKKEIYGTKNWEAGSLVASYMAARQEKIKEFFIFTKDNMNDTFDCRFGRVVKGLKVLRHAISRYDSDDISNVVIEDCGIIFPRS